MEKLVIFISGSRGTGISLFSSAIVKDWKKQMHLAKS
jgi:hypothetical protein